MRINLYLVPGSQFTTNMNVFWEFLVPLLISRKCLIEHKIHNSWIILLNWYLPCCVNIIDTKYNQPIHSAYLISHLCPPGKFLQTCSSVGSLRHCIHRACVLECEAEVKPRDCLFRGMACWRVHWKTTHISSLSKLEGVSCWYQSLLIWTTLSNCSHALFAFRKLKLFDGGEVRSFTHIGSACNSSVYR